MNDKATSEKVSEVFFLTAAHLIGFWLHRSEHLKMMKRILVAGHAEKKALIDTNLMSFDIDAFTS